MSSLVPGGLALRGDLHQDLFGALACQRAAAAGSGGHLGAVSQGGAVFSPERFLLDLKMVQTAVQTAVQTVYTVYTSKWPFELQKF